MKSLCPQIEPHAHGLLAVTPEDLVYWEVCGSPEGKPALVLHGGPGSGCTPWHRRLFEPAKYRVVLLDQRGCGHSLPHASALTTSLLNNTTDNLVADIESPRKHLGISRWLVLGGSWGSALALTYAERHPEAVSELVLFGVTTGRREEFDWLFREGLGMFFPDAWEARRRAVPDLDADDDIVEAYHRRLHHPDQEVRQKAAAAWCLWESATANWPPKAELSPRFRDRQYAMAYARLVTHYARHDGWLSDGRVLGDVARLGGIPGRIVCGRFDFQAPIGTASRLHRVWPDSNLVIVDNAGHTPTERIVEELLRATDEFAPDQDAPK